LKLAARLGRPVPSLLVRVVDATTAGGDATATVALLAIQD
jgi:hypothetical protein